MVDSENKIKYAKYIPPEIEFKGDLTKMKINLKIDFNKQFINRLMFFKNNI